MKQKHINMAILRVGSCLQEIAQEEDLTDSEMLVVVGKLIVEVLRDTPDVAKLYLRALSEELSSANKMTGNAGNQNPPN